MTEQKNNNNMGSKTKIVFGLGILGIVMVLSIGIYALMGLSRVSTDDAYIDGRIHMVAFKVPGTVARVNVDDNQAVKKGDLLVELDPADYELKVKVAQAALEAEKKRLVDAEAGIKTAAANLEIQEVTLNQANLDMERAEKLYKEAVITKERYEKITTAYKLAQAQVKAAKEQLAKATALRDLEASLVNQSEAALNISQLNLTYTKISSSANGYVTKKSVEVGNQVQIGQPLMAVVDLDDIWIIANYKETQLKNVRPGQKVSIKVDTYPGSSFTGKVDSIMAGTGAVFSLFPPENALGNYVKVVQRIPVKITLDKNTDKEHKLRIGMSVLSTIITRNE